MKTSRKNAAEDDNPQSENNERTTENKSKVPGDDDCRCKEVSKKTPMELLKLMINDLSIWKK